MKGLTSVSRGGGNWMREGEWISHRHRLQCGDGQRKWVQGLSGCGQRLVDGDICNRVNNKKKEKNVGLVSMFVIYFIRLVGLG